VLWLGNEALNAKEFVKDGKRKTMCLHTLRSVIHAVDQFVTKMLGKCAPCPSATAALAASA
jgi:hypothetical protein